MMDIIVFGLVGTGMLFAVIRLIVGPTPADRVVSLDTLNVIVIGVIGLLALTFNNSLYLDIAIEPVKAVEFIYIPVRIKNTGEIAAGNNA